MGRELKLVVVFIVAYAVGLVSFVLAMVVIYGINLVGGGLSLGQALRVLASYSLLAYIVALPFNLACVGMMLLARKVVPRTSERISIGLCVILGIFAGLVATLVLNSIVYYLSMGNAPSLGQLFTRKKDLEQFFCFFGPSSVAFCMGWWWVFSRDVSHRISNANSTPTLPSG